MTTKPVKLLPFDVTRYLTNDAAIAEYMTAVLETGDPQLLVLALSDVAEPRFDIVLKVADSLDIKLAVQTV